MTELKTDDLTDDATKILVWAWETYQQREHWPTIADLDRFADRTLKRKLDDLLEEVPNWWLSPDLTRQQNVFQSNSEVRLTFLACGSLDPARPAAEICFSMLNVIVQAADTFEPSAPGATLVVNSEEMKERFPAATTETSAYRYAPTMLIQGDIPGVSMGSSGDGSATWAITVYEQGTRAYRGLNSLGDLLTRIVNDRRSTETQYSQHFQLLEKKQVADEFRATDDSESTNSINPRDVFLVHGRNELAKHAMTAFLESLGLRPLDLQKDVAPVTGKAAPSILECVIAGFDIAQAVVVLFTPDEESTLRPELVRNSQEGVAVWQARPNVYFEAGYAFNSHAERTILIEVGNVHRLSDLSNLLAVQMNDTEYARGLIIDRLQSAGCELDVSSDDWKTAGDFAAAAFDEPQI
jgi:predicted nucleotide-binding protein